VNGSLWTIQVEAWLYLVVGCLILLRITRHAAAFNAFLVLAVLAYAFFPGPLLAWIPRHDEPITPSFVGCFMLGAAIYVNARFVPLSFLACGVLIAATIASAGTQAFDPLFYVTFSYCVVCLALQPQLYIARWNDRVDYSYGIYVRVPFSDPSQPDGTGSADRVLPDLLSHHLRRRGRLLAFRGVAGTCPEGMSAPG
jgi:hypothetical protein